MVTALTKLRLVAGTEYHGPRPEASAVSITDAAKRAPEPSSAMMREAHDLVMGLQLSEGVTARAALHWLRHDANDDVLVQSRKLMDELFEFGITPTGDDTTVAYGHVMLPKKLFSKVKALKAYESVIQARFPLHC